MNLFAIPVFSFVPPKYRELMEEKKGKIFGSLLIFFIIMGMVNGVMAFRTIGSFNEIVRESCPEFLLKDGEFSIEEAYEMDEDGVYVVIDDSIDKVTAADVEQISSTDDYESVMIVGRKSAGIYSNRQIQTIDYDELPSFEFSKQTLTENIVPGISVVVFICCVLGAFISIGIYYLVVLILQFVTGLIAKNIFKCELDETERFKMTVLAKFPPHVLVFILSRLGLNIGFFINLILQVGFIALVVYFYSKDDEI